LGAVTQYHFCWLQTRGPALVYFTAAPTLLDHVGPGGATTAGQALSIASTVDQSAQYAIGTAVAVSGEANAAHVVNLDIE